MVDLVIPGLPRHAPDRRAARAGVRAHHRGDFRSMIFPTQYRVPSYTRWLLYEADMAPAYRWHRQFLQHLQSRHPADRWVLKSPGHIWCLDALLAEYPDALLVQTHRDPLRIIASLGSLVSTLRVARERRRDHPRGRGRVRRLHHRRARPFGDRPRRRHRPRRPCRRRAVRRVHGRPVRDDPRHLRAARPRAHRRRPRRRMRDVPRVAPAGPARQAPLHVRRRPSSTKASCANAPAATRSTSPCPSEALP